MFTHANLSSQVKHWKGKNIKHGTCQEGRKEIQMEAKGGKINFPCFVWLKERSKIKLIYHYALPQYRRKETENHFLIWLLDLCEEALKIKLNLYTKGKKIKMRDILGSTVHKFPPNPQRGT